MALQDNIPLQKCQYIWTAIWSAYKLALTFNDDE